MAQLEMRERAAGVEVLSASQRGKTPHVGRLARQSALFVTDSTEYEVRDGICCSVRDRSTGAWRLNHRAVGMRLACVPQCGQILHLIGDSFTVLMTSIVEEVRTTYRQYVTQPLRSSSSFASSQLTERGLSALARTRTPGAADALPVSSNALPWGASQRI